MFILDQSLGAFFVICLIWFESTKNSPAATVPPRAIPAATMTNWSVFGSRNSPQLKQNLCIRPSVALPDQWSSRASWDWHDPQSRNGSSRDCCEMKPEIGGFSQRPAVVIGANQKSRSASQICQSCRAFALQFVSFSVELQNTSDISAAEPRRQ